jgi:hypothetical protein
MATKPSLIIVHGMGKHTEASFKKEIVDSLNYSLKLYDKWKNKKIENLVDIVPFEYDSIFNKHRKSMSDVSKPLSDRFANLMSSGITAVVGEITKWEVNDD